MSGFIAPGSSVATKLVRHKESQTEMRVNVSEIDPEVHEEIVVEEKDAEGKSRKPRETIKPKEDKKPE